MTGAPPSPARSRTTLDLPTAGVAVGAAVISYAVAITLLIIIPTRSEVAGVAQYLVSGLAPIAAVAVAYVVRSRDPRSFGIRRVPVKWLLIAVGAGVLAVVLSILVTVVTVLLTGPPSDLQKDYRAASSGGPVFLVLTLFAGAVLTPLGEELLFRGVIAHALMRWGAPIAVPVSAAIFALAHGIDYVLPVAFVIGLIAALLFRATGSIWPGVVVHAINNTYTIVVSAIAAAAA